MRPIPLLMLLLATPPLVAQTTLLDEDFSGGLPGSWNQVHYPGSQSSGWRWDGASQAMHHPNLRDSDNALITPLLDFGNMTEVFLHLEAETRDAVFLHQHWTGMGQGRSTIEVTTDRGTTWEPLWDDRSDGDGTYRFTIDLSHLAGESQVRLGFHYEGDWDHEWLLHRVRVDDTPLHSLDLSLRQLHPGSPNRSSLLFEGASMGGWVDCLFSLQGIGPSMTRFGIVHLSHPLRYLGSGNANDNGQGMIFFQMPAAASGFTFPVQALDRRSGVLSNPLSIVVP